MVWGCLITKKESMKFKIILLSIITLFIATSFKIASKSDDYIGNCVTYKVNVYRDPNGDTSKDKLMQKTDLFEYELYYNKSISVFKSVDRMQEDDNDDHLFQLVKRLAGGLCYKDIEKKEKLTQIESFGETFNVIKPYDEYKWDITTETKIINGYKCYKATTHKEEFDEKRNRTNRFNPIVWFAPEIPVPFGPKGLDGLPGLVLEGTFNGKLYFYATKIELNKKISKAIFDKPKKEKYVTEKEFVDIDNKNFENNVKE